MCKDSGRFMLVDRSDPKEQFFFITSVVLLISILIFAFCSSILDTYVAQIKELQQKKEILSKQLKVYQLANKFSEEYGITLMRKDPGEALSIARMARAMYIKALRDIAMRYNPSLSTSQANDIINTIYDESLKYEFNPLEIASVIAQESQFCVDARSDKGALGLMQIMPDTGQILAKSYGINWNEATDTLLNPVTNIKLGIYYLWDLRKLYPSLYLIGYNGGPGAASKVAAGFEVTDVLCYHREVTSRFGNFRHVYGQKMSTWTTSN